MDERRLKGGKMSFGEGDLHLAVARLEEAVGRLEAENAALRADLDGLGKVMRRGNGQKRPVVRSDGVRYGSITEAAGELVEEFGMRSRDSVASNICKALRGCSSTAYGFGWRYE